jgi:3',5'-cyclic AMP phosphodiesterase CpdA
MRLLHFSDIHIPPVLRTVPVKEWFSKRLFGALNLAILRGRRFPGVRQKLDKLIRFAREENVDLALATGDFTLFGTHGEFEEARHRLQPFVDLPGGLVVVPGNHDRYAPDTVLQRRFLTHFDDLLVSDLEVGAGRGPWPLVRLPDPRVAVVALDSSVAHRKPWHAWGELSDAQIDSLRAILEEETVRDRFVFVLLHHAPFSPDGGPDSKNHGLKGAGRFFDACRGIRRGAVLFGHIHRCYRIRVPDCAATFFNAGSATLMGAEGGWVFDVRDDGVTASGVHHYQNRYTLNPQQRFEC